MVETPAAVRLAGELAAASAFLSVGTNDLTQYTLAVDRGNARLAERFSPLHPAMVRQLGDVQLRGGRGGRAGVDLWRDGVGSLAVLLLLGLGFDAAQRGAAGAADGQVGGAPACRSTPRVPPPRPASEGNIDDRGAPTCSCARPSGMPPRPAAGRSVRRVAAPIGGHYLATGPITLPLLHDALTASTCATFSHPNR